VQFDMAENLLGHATDLLGDPRATPTQLRYLLERTREALTDAHRIAVSRSARSGHGPADL
jgi:hypothetical protein